MNPSNFVYQWECTKNTRLIADLKVMIWIVEPLKLGFLGNKKNPKILESEERDRERKMGDPQQNLLALYVEKDERER